MEKYEGWLISTSFWKRAFAVLGHCLAAQSIILVVLFIPIIILGLMLGFIRGMMG